MNTDEIIFCGAYKEFRLGIRFDMAGKSPEEAARALIYVSSRIEPHAYRFSGLNTAVIEDIVSGFSGSGVPAVYGFLDSHPTKELKEMLAKSVPDSALLTVAESCLFNSMLTKAGVPFKAAEPKPQTIPTDEKIEDFIGFVGKCGTWLAIKKLGLEKVKDYEVSGILSGINNTALNKAFDFSGAKKDFALVNAIAAGKRKSYGNLGMALRISRPRGQLRTRSSSARSSRPSASSLTPALRC